MAKGATSNTMMTIAISPEGRRIWSYLKDEYYGSHSFRATLETLLREKMREIEKAKKGSE